MREYLELVKIQQKKIVKDTILSVKLGWVEWQHDAHLKLNELPRPRHFSAV